MVTNAYSHNRKIIIMYIMQNFLQSFTGSHDILIDVFSDSGLTSKVNIIQ